MTLIITDKDVEDLISMRECIDAMRVCFSQFAEGIAVSRPRLRYRVPTQNHDYTYSANIHVGAVPAFDTAIVRAGSNVGKTVDPSRRGTQGPTPSNPGLVILYSLSTGEPLALIHEYYLSGIRVAATSALALEAIAPATEVVGLIGTGKQAKAHLEAFSTIPSVQRVHVYSPNPIHLAEFVSSAAKSGPEIIPETSPEGLTSNVRAVCCATSSLSPVLLGRWLHEGQLVISIANTDINSPAPRSEVDADVILMASSVIVNDRESIHSNNQRELLDLIADGTVLAENIHELGEVIVGSRPVTLKDDNIIYYKNNTGMGMQFAAAGAIIYQNALKHGVEHEIPTEWLVTDLSDAYAKGFYPSP